MTFHRTRRTRSRRRGVSLAEVVAAAVAAAAVMSLSAGLIGTLFQLERHGREDVQQAVSLSRLAEQFRDDMHAAESAQSSSPAADGASAAAAGPARVTLRLELPDGAVIEYQVQNGAVLRVVLRNNAPTHRERYRLPANTAVAWQLGESLTVVGFAVEQALEDERTRRTLLHVEAILGSDARYRDYMRRP